MNNSKFTIKNLRLYHFTLVELLVVVGVMGVLMSLSMPEFTKLIKGNKINNVVSKIGSTLVYCRSYAVSKRCKTRFTITDAGSDTTSAKYTVEYLKKGGNADNASDWLCLETGLEKPVEKKLESTVTVDVFTKTFRATGVTEEASSTINVRGAESTGTKKIKVNQFTGKVSYPST